MMMTSPITSTTTSATTITTINKPSPSPVINSAKSQITLQLVLGLHIQNGFNIHKGKI